MFGEPLQLWTSDEEGGVNFLRNFYATKHEEKSYTLVRLQIDMTASLIWKRFDAKVFLRENPDTVVLQERSCPPRTSSVPISTCYTRGTS